MIRQAVCASARTGFLAGVHQSNDRYRIALYSASATLGVTTSNYTPDGEVDGSGYEAGGKDVPNWRVLRDIQRAVISFDPIAWHNSSIAARGALIYNASHGSLPAVAVLDFGEVVRSVNGPFTVKMDKLLTLESEPT